MVILNHFPQQTCWSDADSNLYHRMKGACKGKKLKSRKKSYPHFTPHISESKTNMLITFANLKYIQL